MLNDFLSFLHETAIKVMVWVKIRLIFLKVIQGNLKVTITEF